MAIDPAATSARPAVTTMAVVADGDPRKPGRQREGNGQSVGHADHDVANRLAGREMVLDVWCLGHGFLLVASHLA